MKKHIILFFAILPFCQAATDDIYMSRMDGTGEFVEQKLTPTGATEYVGFNASKQLILKSVATMKSELGIPSSFFSGSYNDLNNKPTLGTLASQNATITDYALSNALALVATTGNYNDLIAKPTLGTLASQNATITDYALASSLATVATTGNYLTLNNRPSLATVATSGSYADLSNKPTLGTLASQNGTLTDYALTTSLAAVATTGNFASINFKPTTLSGYGITDAVASTTLQYYATNNSVTSSLGNYVLGSALNTWAGSGNITTIGTLQSGSVPWARVTARYNANNGFEAGNGSLAFSGGGAIGNSAFSAGGGAVGDHAFSVGGGFSGGSYASTADTSNAVQLGTGTNGNDNTIQFLSAGSVNVTQWGYLANTTATGGALMTTNNATATLGLGTAAFAATGDFATAAQGTLADSAVQPAVLGNYTTTSGLNTLLGNYTTTANLKPLATTTITGNATAGNYLAGNYHWTPMPAAGSGSGDALLAGDNKFTGNNTYNGTTTLNGATTVNGTLSVSSIATTEPTTQVLDVASVTVNSTTLTIPSNANIIEISSASAQTISNFSGAVSGAKYTIRNVGLYTITFSSGANFTTTPTVPNLIVLPGYVIEVMGYGLDGRVVMSAIGGSQSGDDMLTNAQYFGDGIDGDVVISNGTIPLNRDMFYNNLTINGTGQVITGGFRIFVSNTLDLSAASASSIIPRSPNYGLGLNGGSGGVGGAAGTPQSSGTITAAAGGTTGAAGGITIGSNGTSPTAQNIMTADMSVYLSAMGAKGGNGTSGVGGLASVSPSNISCPDRIPSIYTVRGTAFYTSGIGGGGGGGGGGDGVNSGGGGGGGGAAGGFVLISAKNVNRGLNTTEGIISMVGRAGGRGGSQSVGSCGGGGGGGGGSGGGIRLIYRSLTGATIANAIDYSGGAGGAGGNGTSTGIGGGGGSSGDAGFSILWDISSGSSTWSQGSAGSAASGTTGGTGAATNTQKTSL